MVGKALLALAFSAGMANAATEWTVSAASSVSLYFTAADFNRNGRISTNEIIDSSIDISSPSDSTSFAVYENPILTKIDAPVNASIFDITFSADLYTCIDGGIQMSEVDACWGYVPLTFLATDSFSLEIDNAFWTAGRDVPAPVPLPASGVLSALGVGMLMLSALRGRNSA